MDRWKGGWMRKKEESTAKEVSLLPMRETEKVTLEYPMREVPGGGYVHVPDRIYCHSQMIFPD